MQRRGLLIVSLALVIQIIILFPLHVNAALYKSYVFNAWGEAVPTPEPYIPVKVIYGMDLGIGNFRNAQDIFAAPDNTLYIVDSGNNRIIRTTSDFTVLNIFQEFEHDGIVDKFNNPHSVFVTKDGRIFVADTNNQRIVVFDEDRNFSRIIGAPETDNPSAFEEHFRFRPKRIAVDMANRVYITVDGLYEGLMEMDLQGRFRTFMGAPRVSLSPWQYFWNRMASDEQRQRMQLLLPTEYSSMALDEQGLILTTVSGGEIQDDHYIRKLNPAGVDILRRYGFHPPMGDINIGFISGITGNSKLVDIIGRENGMFSALDQLRGRIFTYDSNGNLLYVFGGIGQGIGLFVSPVSLTIVDDLFLVLDSRNNSITVFEPTVYALAIHEAISEYHKGRYESSAEHWRRVITMNANNELAYSGVANAYFQQCDYEKAMYHYKLGNDREGYSKAFYRYRKQLIGEKFGTIITSVLVIIVLFYIASKRAWIPRLRQMVKRSRFGAFIMSVKVQNNRIFAYTKRTWEAIRYATYVIFHPFDGFWDLKHEGRGTFSAATIILVLTILSYVFMRQYTGFVLNYNRIEDLNIFSEMISILGPFLLWCLVNWALTTLMDGKGKMKDIYIAGAYSLTPMIFINIPITIISNFITVEEGTFYYLLLVVGVIWALSLLFLGTGVVHDYSFGKTIFTTLATIVGIGVVCFVGLLFFDVLDRMLRFGQDIYTELAFRS